MLHTYLKYIKNFNLYLKIICVIYGINNLKFKNNF